MTNTRIINNLFNNNIQLWILNYKITNFLNNNSNMKWLMYKHNSKQM